MNCANCSIDSSSVRAGYKFSCKFNQRSLYTPVISNRDCDIILASPSPHSSLPFSTLLYSNLTTSYANEN